MCYRSLKEACEAVDKNGRSLGLGNDVNVKAVMQELETEKQHTIGFPPLPKMGALKNILIQHFGRTMRDEEEGRDDSTRVRTGRKSPGRSL